jgi:hypothetical protein
MCTRLKGDIKPKILSAFSEMWKFVQIPENRILSVQELKRGEKEFEKLSSMYTWHAVPLLVEALGYKPKGHGFDSRWGC